MKGRKLVAATLTSGLGLAGLFLMPEAEATLPCGTWQPNNSQNSTGRNEGDAGINLNNAGNLQGNNTSGASNVLCGADLLSGNKVVLFNDYEGGTPAPSSDRCELLQQNHHSVNKTGDNNVDSVSNTNNVANLQGNHTSGISNLGCDADVLSNNTVVLFGNATGGYSETDSADKCLTTQNNYSKNSTGSNILGSLGWLPVISNLNNIGNLQGNNTSVASNVACDADVASDNFIVIGGSYTGGSGTSSSGTPRQCQETQTQQSNNQTGLNSILALINANNLLGSQGNNTSGASNVLCDADVMSGNLIVLGDILSRL